MRVCVSVWWWWCVRVCGGVRVRACVLECVVVVVMCV